METPNYMTRYWEKVIEEAELKIEYAKHELAKIALRQTMKKEEEK